jgi:hypothetical protein
MIVANYARPFRRAFFFYNQEKSMSSNDLKDLSSLCTVSVSQISVQKTTRSRDACLCSFTFSDGRRCRMPRRSESTEFCFHHERQLRRLHELDETTSRICEPMEGYFVPATALTQTLTRVFRAVAEGRIDRKSATTLTRVAATLLKSIDASSAEFQSSYCESYWRQLIRDRYNDLPEYIPPPPRLPRMRSTNEASPNSSNSGGNNSGNNNSGS